MPREDPELEAERKARTPYDLVRYRLEKLQENPVSLKLLALYFIDIIVGQVSAYSTAKRSSKEESASGVCPKCCWFVGCRWQCRFSHLPK